MTERRTFQVGYFVTVEVDAIDEREAAQVGEVACGWPGHWNPPEGPVEVVGELNGKPVTARILRSLPLMVRRKES